MPRIRSGRVSCLHPGLRYPGIPVKVAIHSETPARQRALPSALVICVGLGPRSHPAETNTRVFQEEFPQLTPQEIGNQTGQEKDKDCK